VIYLKKKRKVWILILVLILLIPLIIIIYPVSKNNNYQKDLEERIIKNTSIKNITYLNKDNNYYIIKNNKEIIVLDLNYEEVYKVSLEDIKEEDKELTYRRNNLYYVDKVREKDKLTYIFYNISSGEEEYSLEVGG